MTLSPHRIKDTNAMPITRRMMLLAGSAAALLALPTKSRAEDIIRIATLASGTVAWEIDTILHHGLDRKFGFTLSVVPVAGKQSADVMLAAGACDVIVTDWIWVSRQRQQGADYTFIPYSKQIGALLTKPNSSIKTLADLKGKKIGVAGGPTDKSWILICAFAKKTMAIDLEKDSEAVFAAPRLLNEEFERDHIDAIMTYWQFSYPLKAKGARELIALSDVAKTLGLDPDTPLLGYVFSERLAKTHSGIATKLARASQAAKLILAKDEEEWIRLRPLMNVETDQDFEALKAGFRAGIPAATMPNKVAAERLLQALSESGDTHLRGENATLASGTFAEF